MGKMGRPTVFTKGRERINLHVEPDLASDLKALAKKFKIPLNELLREMLRSSLREIKKEIK
jgi:hypothetical protein